MKPLSMYARKTYRQKHEENPRVELSGDWKEAEDGAGGMGRRMALHESEREDDAAEPDRHLEDILHVMHQPCS